MEVTYVRPQDIERRSFEIIARELKERGIELPEEQAFITKRVIHTSADFDYARTLCYSSGAVGCALSLLRDGAQIVTDTEMALAGINKTALARLGGSARCFMSDDAVALEAKRRGVTRASISMEKALALKGPLILAIGNAPTALLTLYEQLQKNGRRPGFLIGVPVGFVNVEVSKECFLQTDVPYIINRGRKGGSNVAAAICNALIYRALEEKA